MTKSRLAGGGRQSQSHGATVIIIRIMEPDNFTQSLGLSLLAYLTTESSGCEAKSRRRVLPSILIRSVMPATNRSGEEEIGSLARPH